jgi:hypothetical protein
MSIDLTEADEQDWLAGEESPPIRYSELTTDDERDSAVIEQLREPLTEVLSEWFSDRGYTTISTSSTKTEAAAQSALNWLEKADENSSITDILDSVEKTDTDESGWLDRYLRDVAEAVVEEISDEALETIGSMISDSKQRKRPRKSDTVSDQAAIGKITQNRRLE